MQIAHGFRYDWTMARILVVEDSSAVRAYIRAALEDAPQLFARGPEDAASEVEVVEASSVFDAMRLLPRGQFDLVITDINMPDINGLELIRFVRDSERHRKVAMMIISTQSSEKDQKRGLALGADVFLAKPFTVEALRQAVVASLHGRSTAFASDARDADGAQSNEGSR
jgi:two-component system, chemotaxis family, chemotaxis protein CheY